SENRATDCADACAGTTANAKATKTATQGTRSDSLGASRALGSTGLYMLQHVRGGRRQARQRGGQRRDDFRVKLAAGAAPQLPQRVARWASGAVGACARKRGVRIGH